MKTARNRTMTVLTLAAVGVAAIGLAPISAHAGAIAGVDFESTPGAPGNSGNFDRTPDDLDLADGITVSADWTAADLRWDNGAQTSPVPPSTITARMQGQNSWSITIPDTQVLDLTDITFLIRGGTGSSGTPTSRSASFNTSLDGGPGGTMLWSNPGLLSRPTWTPVSVDLSGATYQNLTDTTLELYWYALTGGTDIDTIELSGTVSPAGGGSIPEPMTMLAVGMSLAGLGGYVRKRRRG